MFFVGATGLLPRILFSQQDRIPDMSLLKEDLSESEVIEHIKQLGFISFRGQYALGLAPDQLSYTVVDPNASDHDHFLSKREGYHLLVKWDYSLNADLNELLASSRQLAYGLTIKRASAEAEARTGHSTYSNVERITLNGMEAIRGSLSFSTKRDEQVINYAALAAAVRGRTRCYLVIYVRPLDYPGIDPRLAKIFRDRGEMGSSLFIMAFFGDWYPGVFVRR